MTEAQQFAFASLTRGDLFPWATIRDAARVKFGFHTLGGRYLVFCFFRLRDSSWSAGRASGSRAPQAVFR